MSYVHWAYQPATYTIRYVGWHIYGYRVTWCQGGNKYEKKGYAFSGTKALEKGKAKCRKINDPTKQWRTPPQ